MLAQPRQFAAILAVLSILSVAPRPLRAAQSEDHVVPLSQLHEDVNAAASQRAKNLADIDQVLSTPAAQEQLSRANLKSDTVQAAISRLDDKELAQLADHARAAGQDVRAGGSGTAWFLAGLVLFVVLIVALTQVL